MSASLQTQPSNNALSQQANCCHHPNTPPTQALPLIASNAPTPQGVNTQQETQRQKRRKILQINTSLECPGPRTTPLEPESMAFMLWHHKRNKARSLTASDAVNIIYHNDMNIKYIDSWRLVTAKEQVRSGNTPQQQKQYHTHYTPMIIEKWALPIFRKAGFTSINTHPAARTDIECACCEVCYFHLGIQPEKSEPPFDDMYICEVCNRTYHWTCLKNLGCYTDMQRAAVDNDDDWACPACAGLDTEGKKTDNQSHAIKNL